MELQKEKISTAPSKLPAGKFSKVITNWALP
jgi:hypothetical protein